MTQRLGLAVMTAWLLLLPAPASAQNDEPLTELLVNLYRDVALDNARALAGAFGLPATFDEALLLNALGSQLDVPETLNEQIAKQAATFPLGSSASGFTWTFVPATATFERSSESFGPTFVERALTVGARKFNFGVNYQRATFDKIEGQELQGGDIRVYTGLEGVFFEDALDLTLTTDTVGLFANYGISDRLDVGIAVPIISVRMDAGLTTHVGTSSGGILPTATTFVERRKGSASGIGDIVGRAKYNFWKRSGGGLAAGVDFRFPTGDELNLLGVAGYQSKLYVAASGAVNTLSPHFNFGYTFSGESEAATSVETFVFAPLDELHYAGGVDVAVTPRLTIVGDLLGRTLRDSFILEETPTEFGSQFTEFTSTIGNAHQTLGAVGVKFNPWATTLVSGNVLIPLNKRGLTDNVTWSVGVDFAF